MVLSSLTKYSLRSRLEKKDGKKNNINISSGWISKTEQKKITLKDLSVEVERLVDLALDEVEASMGCIGHIKLLLLSQLLHLFILVLLILHMLLHEVLVDLQLIVELD